MDSASTTLWDRVLQNSTLLYKKKKDISVFLSSLTLSSIAVIPGEGEWLLLILSVKSSVLVRALPRTIALCKEKTQQNCFSWQVQCFSSSLGDNGWKPANKKCWKELHQADYWDVTCRHKCLWDSHSPLGIGNRATCHCHLSQKGDRWHWRQHQSWSR